MIAVVEIPWSLVWIEVLSWRNDMRINNFRSLQEQTDSTLFSQNFKNTSIELPNDELVAGSSDCQLPNAKCLILIPLRLPNNLF